jgi:hypothetical protein
VWNENGQEAHLGKYAFGFAWGAAAALLLATIGFCGAGRGRRYARKEYV